MSNGNRNTNVPRFTIRRMSAEEAERSRRQQAQARHMQPEPPVQQPIIVEPPEPVPEKPISTAEPEEPQVITGVTGACFRSAGAVLAFLSSALGTGLIDEALVRHSSDGRWWAEVPVSDIRLVPLVWTSGGRPYGYHENQWQALSISGELPGKDEKPEIIDAQSWPMVELSHLLARTGMKPGYYRALKRLDVLVPGALGRWVLRRAAALGLEVSIRTVNRSPLEDGSETGTGALLFQLTAGAQVTEIPAALVYSLTRLPYVIAADPGGGEKLLVDVRCRSPLPVNILENMVPHDQVWVLGPRETGSWRLRFIGEVIDGALLLEVPGVPIKNLTIPGEPGRAVMPQPVPVRLKPGLGNNSQVDAVLVDDMELEWLKSFLPTRNPAELYFLLPGDGLHVLLSPGGLPGIGVPFGVPLVHTGPMGLYMEVRQEFFPPMPDAARIERYRLDENSLVIVTQKGTFRYATGNLLPAWVLWVGPIPGTRERLSEKSQALLSKISKALIPEEVKHFQEPKQKEKKPVTREERSKRLEEAQKQELKGNFLEAAENMEAAGYPGPAGRLYERAAGGALFEKTAPPTPPAKASI
jgi:hypothetical protein